MSGWAQKTMGTRDDCVMGTLLKRQYGTRSALGEVC